MLLDCFYFCEMFCRLSLFLFLLTILSYALLRFTACNYPFWYHQIIACCYFLWSLDRFSFSDLRLVITPVVFSKFSFYLIKFQLSLIYFCITIKYLHYNVQDYSDLYYNVVHSHVDNTCMTASFH